ncbi:hypothetical protein DFH06DRAFT_1311739 [Mycena polygramma]|nr:hypothetical protein DFH06DRAFT_1311739 [Mycena polygramma]
MYELDLVEQWWQKHQEWLETCGYLLRPRYRTGWKRPLNREQQLRGASWVMDAARVSDGVTVALKRVPKASASGEENIMRLLNSEPLVSHPDNPCPPLYQVLDVLDEEDVKILVLPYLRRFDSPPFETIGEVMDFCRQALRGLRFLHEHHIAHRDPHFMNIMLDPRNMYPTGFYTGNARYAHRTSDLSARAKGFTRTQRPSKYYWIDYGLSVLAPADALLPYVRGGDKNIPETQQRASVANPFAADVWWMGNLIQEHLMERYSGLQCLKPLVASMCQDHSLTVRRKDLLWRFLEGLPAYIVHTVPHILRRVPALPLAVEEDDRRGS